MYTPPHECPVLNKINKPIAILVYGLPSYKMDNWIKGMFKKGFNKILYSTYTDALYPVYGDIVIVCDLLSKRELYDRLTSMKEQNWNIYIKVFDTSVFESFLYELLKGRFGSYKKLSKMYKIYSQLNRSYYADLTSPF